MYGDDQIVPYADPAPLSATLVQNGTLKMYAGFPHSMPTTHAETINAVCVPRTPGTSGDLHILMNEPVACQNGRPDLWPGVSGRLRRFAGTR